MRLRSALALAASLLLGFPVPAAGWGRIDWRTVPAARVKELLVAAGAAVNAKVSVLDNMGFTPLMYAAQSNPNPAVVRALVRAGAKPGITDAMDRTALVLAAKYNGNPGVLAALIAGGAEVNLVCRDYANIGWTPLMFAAASGERPLPKVALLLAAGADARARSRDGGTALDRAAANPAVDRRSPVYRALARASR